MKLLHIFIAIWFVACRQDGGSVLNDSDGTDASNGTASFGVSFDTEGNYNSNTYGETIVDLSGTYSGRRGGSDAQDLNLIGGLFDSIVSVFSSGDNEPAEEGPPALEADDPLTSEHGDRAPRPTRTGNVDRQREQYRTLAQARTATERQRQTSEQELDSQTQVISESALELLESVNGSGHVHNAQALYVATTIDELEAVAASLKDAYKTPYDSPLGKKIRRKSAYVALAERGATTAGQQEMLAIAKSALSVADDYASAGNAEEAEFAMELATAFTDLAIGLTPGVSWLNDFGEAVYGYDIHGNELSTLERASAMLGVATGGLGSKVLKIGKALAVVGKIVLKAGRAGGGPALDAARGFANTAQKIGWDAGDIATLRKGSAKIDRFGPTKKGPLHDLDTPTGSVADTFRSSSYFEVTTKEPTKLYRVYGNNVDELGGYWSRTKPTGPLQAQLDAALDPDWGNSATKWTEITVPPRETIYDGVASEIVLGRQSGIEVGSLLGGGNQVFINRRIPDAWKTNGGDFQ